MVCSKLLRPSQIFPVCMCLITSLGIGYIYSFGIIENFYINAYGWSHASLSFAFSLSLISFSLQMLLCSVVSRHMSPRGIIFLSSCFFLFGFLFLKHAASVHMIYIGFGLFIGSGTGLAYQTILTYVHSLKYTYKKVIEGAVLCLFAFSGSICTGFLKTIDMFYDWRFSLLVAGILCFLLLNITAFSFKNYTVIKYEPSSTLLYDDMIRSRSFLYLMLWIIFIGSFAMGHMANASIITMQSSITEGRVFIQILLPMSNAIGRLVYTVVSHIVNVKYAIKYVSICISVSSCLFILFILANNILFYYISSTLSLIIFGFVTALLPQCIDRLYGSLYFSAHYAICNLQLLITSLFGPILVLWLYRNTVPAVIILIITTYFNFKIGIRLSCRVPSFHK